MFAQALQHLRESDPVLAPILARTELPVLESSQHFFHDLMSCIIEQQIHYRSSKHIFAKLLERAGLTWLTPENFEQFEELALPHIKLSMRKVETLGIVVEFFEQHPNIAWEALSDAEIRALWKPVKGIGPWTVDMLLLYTLGRPNIFPAEDYSLKKIMDQLYDWTSTPSLNKQRKAIAAEWAPYASTAVRYLLAYQELLKTTIA